MTTETGCPHCEAGNLRGASGMLDDKGNTSGFVHAVGNKLVPCTSPRSEGVGEPPLSGLEESEVLERAIARMGWPEIHAFRDELRKGQDIYEDAGGYWMRAIRRLFGLPAEKDPVVTYQDAARRMVEASEKQKP